MKLRTTLIRLFLPLFCLFLQEARAYDLVRACTGCDTIILEDGKRIFARNTSIQKDLVRYVTCDSLSAPRVIRYRSVRCVRYASQKQWERYPGASNTSDIDNNEGKDALIWGMWAALMIFPGGMLGFPLLLAPILAIVAVARAKRWQRRLGKMPPKARTGYILGAAVLVLCLIFLMFVLLLFSYGI
jgi:hypothetical protein